MIVGLILSLFINLGDLRKFFANPFQVRQAKNTAFKVEKIFDIPVAQTHCGMHAYFNPVHPVNAYNPTLVTPFGMFIDAKLLHPKNARVPMFVTLLGIDSLFKPSV